MRRKNTRTAWEIDISGPDGNAFRIMGVVKNWCKQLGWKHKDIIEEMMKGDYEHLLMTVERYFPDVVFLED